MLNYIQHVMNPAWYHGHGAKAPYFEGWYYKLVTKDGSQKWAIIPGVFIHEKSSETHAFIQVLNGNTGQAYYHRSGVFQAEKNAFKVKIDRDNHFSLDGLRLNVDDALGAIQGEVKLKGLNPWAVSVTAPGVMGWYGWLPMLECYHGVLSLDHELEGKLNLYGEEVDFTGGRGYLEKDWGKSFPLGYIWMQCNHFSTVGTSLSASTAVVPNVGKNSFAGFIVGVRHQGDLHQFTTYNNTKVDYLRVDDTTVEWSLYRDTEELRIKCSRAEGGLLKAPEAIGMQRSIHETMKATIEVELYEIFGPRKSLLLHEVGEHTSLEVAGDLSMLLKR